MTSCDVRMKSDKARAHGCADMITANTNIIGVRLSQTKCLLRLLKRGLRAESFVMAPYSLQILSDNVGLILCAGS